MSDQDGLVTVYLTTAIRTSAGTGPAVSKRLPVKVTRGAIALSDHIEVYSPSLP